MSILTRYVLRRFFFLALFTGLASLLIFVTVDLMENLDKFIDAQTPPREIVQYYLLYLPQIIYLILPVILLLTTVFTLGGLVSRSEITAMKAGGVSPGRLLRLLGFWAGVFSVLAFVLGETLVTQTARERLEINRTRIRRQPSTLQASSGRIYYQNDGTSMFTLENYSFEEQRGQRAVFLRFEDNRLQERIDAHTVLRDSTGWVLVDGSTRFLQPDLRIEPFERRALPELSLDPLDILTLQAAPEEMNLAELQAFIDRQRQAGARVSRWEVNARTKVA
jgi:lipopolysaccharide export system permease protein